jgi:hypothetical protein
MGHNINFGAYTPLPAAAESNLRLERLPRNLVEAGAACLNHIDSTNTGRAAWHALYIAMANAKVTLA